MKQNKKTFYNLKLNKTKQVSLGKNFLNEQNSFMIKNKIDIKNLNTNSNCNIHVMPPQISDNDINALFNGLIKVVKKKFELDCKAEILNSNLTLEKVLNELKAKQAECNRLKNEIIFLKAELNKK